MNIPHEPNFLSRARGCAVGAAVGDALGMSLEFQPPRPLDNLVREMRPGLFPAGSFTDDTQMALALADSLQAHYPLNQDDVTRRFAAWLRDDPLDVGIHTREVLNRVISGASWRGAAASTQAGNPDSASNGSLMRCWPVALACWDSLEALQRASVAQSEVTHPHPDCAAACVFSNTVIYYLLRGDTPAAAVREASSAARLADPFQAMVDGASQRQRHQLANSGWVRHTVESAIWALLTTASYEDAVTQAANLGHDADTSASVTGALAGAAYGLDAIPPRWQAALQAAWPIRSTNMWGADEFAELADRLVNLGSRRP